MDVDTCRVLQATLGLLKLHDNPSPTSPTLSIHLAWQAHRARTTQMRYPLLVRKPHVLGIPVVAAHFEGFLRRRVLHRVENKVRTCDRLRDSGTNSLISSGDPT